MGDVRKFALVAVVALLAFSGATVGSSPARAAAAPSTALPPTYTWPQMHHDPLLSGVSTDPTVTATNAPQLGVNWATNVGSNVLSSPVVAWNATLGETLAYVATNAGDLLAVDEANGEVVWSRALGGVITSTPLVENGYIWATTEYAPKMIKMNAATGITACATTPLATTIDGSPVLGMTNGSPAVFINANDAGALSGPVYSINEGTCAINWSFTNFLGVTGSWTPLSYGIDATGEALVLVGTADVDSTVYAIDANTGRRVWDFVTNGHGTKFDVGSGVVISPPGNNGFADGVAYVDVKTGTMYALDLTTGALIWQWNSPKIDDLRSTPSLSGTQLVFGSQGAVYTVNAVTGLLEWSTIVPEIVGSVAVLGPVGNQVVAYGDLAGDFSVLRLSDGTHLYKYPINGYIAGSVADVDGHLLIGASDGFLYDFALGGGNGTAPTTAITAPADNTTIANPNGSLTITGTAADATSVSAVKVAVQIDGQTGPWWDGQTGSWTQGPFDNAATLASPGAATTDWSFSVPVPARGTTVLIEAYAVNSLGIPDDSYAATATEPGRSLVTLQASTTAPTLTSPVQRVAPGTSLTLSGGGFSPGETIQLDLAGNVPTLVGTTTVGPTGTFSSAVVAIPVKTPFGPLTLTATGETSGRVAGTTVVVSNNWTQFQYDSMHSGTEPNDDTLNGNTGIFPGAFLTQAWEYPDGAALTTQPIVVGGVAYVADANGLVTAIEVHNGVPLWSVSVGAPVYSTPVFDSGTLYVATNTGYLDALSALDGQTVWVDSLGGNIAAPLTFYQGMLYVADMSGTVHAVQSSSGTVLWTVSVGSAVAGAASVLSTAGHAIVVADNAGQLVALNTAHGKTLWTYSTGSALTATPLVFRSRIYEGAANGTLYSLSTSGALNWTFASGASITSAAAGLGTTHVLFGNSSGEFYDLSPTGGPGAVHSSVALGSAVVGTTAALNFVIVITASGNVFGRRTTTSELAQWQWASAAGLSVPATIDNGVVYVAGADQDLHAFTVPGKAVY